MLCAVAARAQAPFIQWSGRLGSSPQPRSSGKPGAPQATVSFIALLGACLAVRPTLYSVSNPWLVNFNVRLFSVTVRTI